MGKIKKGTCTGMSTAESYQLLFNEKKGLYHGSYLLMKARKH